LKRSRRLDAGPKPCGTYGVRRLEADELVDSFLRHGVSFFSMDFAGCGLSGGDIVTLGHAERQDLEVVLDFLKQHDAVSFIALYGRSMGAATALLVASDERYYHCVSGLVLDSCAPCPSLLFCCQAARRRTLPDSPGSVLQQTCTGGAPAAPASRAPDPWGPPRNTCLILQRSVVPLTFFGFLRAYRFGLVVWYPVCTRLFNTHTLSPLMHQTRAQVLRVRPRGAARPLGQLRRRGERAALGAISTALAACP
jgi:pimeloyl-ACP methyl ester carboxylesterase